MTTPRVTVPVEPTEAMLEVLDDAAWFDEGGYQGQESSADTYRKLLAAAPAAPQAAGVGEREAIVRVIRQSGIDRGWAQPGDAEKVADAILALRAPSRGPEGGAVRVKRVSPGEAINRAVEDEVLTAKVLESITAAGWVFAHKDDLATREEAPAVPDDVRRLVEAARVVAFENQGPDAIKALDVASEAFADRVPWEGEPYEEAPALENPDEPSAPENARDWEAPAEAGEREIVAKALAKIKGHRDVNAVIWLNEPQIEKRAWEFYLDDADVVLSALRAQPQARSGEGQ